MHTETAVAKIAIASHVLRRSLISTSGAHRKTRTPGRFTIEPYGRNSMRDASFREQEGQRRGFEAYNDSERQNEQAGTQGAGHPRGSPWGPCIAVSNSPEEKVGRMNGGSPGIIQVDRPLGVKIGPSLLT